MEVGEPFGCPVAGDAGTFDITFELTVPLAECLNIAHRV
jgi:hypothetical protein